MRFVVDGMTVSAVGGRGGATLVRTTKPKGYQRRPERTVPVTGAGGMQARQLKAGSLVFGQRVIGKRIGMKAGYQTVSVQLADGTWTQPFYLNERVPGTAVRTDLLAGPVGAGRGMKANRTGRGGDESPGDWHSRRIDNIQYA
jgi:hypothetical protein